MIQQTTTPKLELGGSAADQELAAQIWSLMRMRGFTFAATRPISLTLDALADYFAGQKYQGLEDRQQLAGLIDQALSASPAVFLREETPPDQALATTDTDAQPVVTFKTTKSGKAPPSSVKPDQHSFKSRLYEAAQPVQAPTEEEIAARQREHALHPTPSLNLPVAAPPTAAPAGAPAGGPLRPAAAQPPVAPAQPTRPAPQPQPAAVQPPVARPSAPTAPPQVSPSVPAQPQRPAAAQPAAAAPAPAPTPVITGPVLVEVADGVTVDVNRPISEVMAEAGDYFASALLRVLQEDFRFVNFSDSWYLEDLTGRYGKNDFRRIREFMQDMEGPVSDRDILRELWGKRQTDPDYEATRFALNFRLHKEKKDFEFVGAKDDNVWTAPGLAQIGNPRHKATEIGTDYKYLEDPNLNDPSELTEEDGIKVWRHVLTFYEYENGVLPFNTTAKELFPGPALEEQKSLILRFEAPQLYYTYTAELRYPTGSRGGWVGGLEQFFEDNLVPGAILVIRQGQRSNHFYIEYEQSDEQNANVLLYDERRQKFVFRPIVFACGVEPENMLTPDRYSKLNGQKRMEESDRKKTDQVVMAAFENCGQKTPQGFYALLDDLYPVANIERPFSRNYLRHLLTHGNSQFQPDESTPDAFFYKPPTTGMRR